MPAWSWVCRCGMHHSLGIPPPVWQAYQQGQEGALCFRDGVADHPPCACAVVVVFGPNRERYNDLLQECKVNTQLLYTLVPAMVSPEPFSFTSMAIPPTTIVNSNKMLMSTHMLGVDAATDQTFPMPSVDPRRNVLWVAQVRTWRRWLQARTTHELPWRLFVPMDTGSAVWLEEPVGTSQ